MEHPKDPPRIIKDPPGIPLEPTYKYPYRARGLGVWRLGNPLTPGPMRAHRMFLTRDPPCPLGLPNWLLRAKAGPLGPPGD